MITILQFLTKVNFILNYSLVRVISKTHGRVEVGPNLGTQQHNANHKVLNLAQNYLVLGRDNDIRRGAFFLFLKREAELR